MHCVDIAWVPAALVRAGCSSEEQEEDVQRQPGAPALCAAARAGGADCDTVYIDDDPVLSQEDALACVQGASPHDAGSCSLQRKRGAHKCCGVAAAGQRAGLDGQGGGGLLPASPARKRRNVSGVEGGMQAGEGGASQGGSGCAGWGVEEGSSDDDFKVRKPRKPKIAFGGYADREANKTSKLKQGKGGKARRR